jgi:hypothetical protein
VVFGKWDEKDGQILSKNKYEKIMPKGEAQ